jgi:hypothetical protein
LFSSCGEEVSKMKFAFGFLFALLNTLSLATSLSAWPPVGGSCNFTTSFVCGVTPKRDPQYYLAREEDCDALDACVGDECLDLLYCTGSVDKAAAQGYGCAFEVLRTCGRRSEENVAKVSKLIEDAPSSWPMNGDTSMLSSGTISSQIATEECVSVQCGVGPDGVEQIYMFDPADCNLFLGSACGSRGCLFCAEGAEIEKTRFSTGYECLGTEGDVIDGINRIYELCGITFP